MEKKIAKKKPALDNAINELVRKLKIECLKAGIPVVFAKESKSFSATEEKIVKLKKEFQEIRDFIILNIITNNVDDCYRILGVLHGLFKPVPKKFKDFIALPEFNLYKALHTTVIGLKGVPIKCYISTFEMHEIADYGVIFFFKNKSAKNMALLKEKTKWIQCLAKPQSAITHADFFQSLNSELLPTMIVFSPQGQRIELPLGSNPIDFAFHIHTDIGMHCEKSIVNGKEVPITTVLNAGDVVEIKTGKKTQASQKWLSLVKSHGALDALRRKFKKQ